MIYSTTHVTSNENGREEVSIERSMTLFEILKTAYKQRSFKFERRTTDTYERVGAEFGVSAMMHEIWMNKKTGRRADDGEMCKILEVQIQVGLNELALRMKK